VTTDLLWTLLGDEALPPGLLAGGIPPGAVTTFDDLRVVAIASTGHFSQAPSACAAGDGRPPGELRRLLQDSEGGHGPGGVAGVVADGGGDVAVAGHLHDRDGELTQGGHDLGDVAP